MKDINIFAIETSCDETSCSIIKNGCIDVATVILSQIDIHKKYGGVVPEIASRSHTEAITLVFEETLKKANMTFDDIDLIAVTYGPGLNGSLLVGIEAAKALSLATGKPLIPVNHMAGHIYANKFVGEFKFPLLALVVSGGHTEIIYMDKEYSFKKVGGTLDDSIGEAYDKVARVVGVPYPGGPLMDKMSHIGKHSYNLPTPKDDSSYDFSFSGIKSAVINLVHNEKQRGREINKEDLATSFQETVVDILVKKTVRAIKEYNVKQLLVAGGVSANTGLRDALDNACKELDVELLKPEIKYCTDNAAMIGAAAYQAYLRGDRADFTLDPNPGLDLDKESINMKNNKGFTLVELLAIVVILAVIMVIVAPNMTKQISKKENTDQTILDEKIYNASRMFAAKYYAADIVSGNGFSFTLQDLEDDGLLDLKGKCSNKMSEKINYNENYDFDKIKGDDCASNNIPIN